MADLSVIIPARNERWLSNTVADVLEHSEADTEVVVVLDGAWADPQLEQHPKVKVVFSPAVIGQRAATNLGVKLSASRYVMKADAHVSFGPGFDRILIESAAELGPDVTQIPQQRNLHVFDWVCDACSFRKYQGPMPKACASCKGEAWHQEIVWKPRDNTRTDGWRFDADLHFQYWPGFKNRPENKGKDIYDVMTSLGACFFMERERFWAIDGLDEGHGGWGQMGVEVALKSMLSGGRHVVNRRTWFSHLFRTQKGFGFPYHLPASDSDYARRYSQNLWRGNLWPKQVLPLRSVIDKYWPVPGWTEEQRNELPSKLPRNDRAARHAVERVDATAVQQSSGVVRDGASQARRDDRPGDTGAHRNALRPSRGIVYYTDNRPDQLILDAVRSTLWASGLPLQAVMLKEEGRVVSRDAGNVIERPDIIFNGHERGYLTMFRQILAGLEALDTDIVFFCEHDVLYSREHFQFEPPKRDVVYYNLHVFKVDYETGRALHYRTKQTSGLCAYRDILIEHYRKRIEICERVGFSRKQGFEPGSHHRSERVDDLTSDVWWSAVPNIDIRHGRNLTASRWQQSEFRDQRNCQGWQEGDAVPGWGQTRGRFKEMLLDICIHGAPRCDPQEMAIAQ